MPVELSFEVEGERQLSVALGATANGISSWRRPLERGSVELLKSFQLNFDARGGLFESGGWTPRKKDHPWPLLEKTGRMRRGFRSSISGDTLTLTNQTDYFKYHQSRQARTGPLPRRVMMKIDEARRRFIVRQFQQHIVEAGHGLIDRG